MSSSVRQRTTKAPETASSTSPGARVKAEDSYNPFSLIEIGRIITLLVLLSCATSWFVTNNDLFWGYRPAYVKLSYWKALITSPVHLTPAQLKKFDGSDPKLPLYLAINGTIYDVSNGRRFYGPGGSYQYFSGVDGTRAFVTGCFAEDLTPDLRGAELMYLPIDDPEVDSQFTSGELKKLKEQERRLAKQQVDQGVKHWVDFFGNSPKYTKVGTVKRPEPTGPPPPLCQKAQDGRQKRRLRTAEEQPAP